MRVLLVHPSALLYSRIFLRLEPLGLEYVAGAIRSAGHEVRLLDLIIFDERDLFRELRQFRPEAIGFSLNYIANIPEVVDLAKAIRGLLPGCFLFAGGHAASFLHDEILEHAGGAIDCVVRGEGEEIAPALLDAVAAGGGWKDLPGIVTLEGSGPPPRLVRHIERHRPARDLTRKRRRYFLGHLDPCASIEFTRGCPWDCCFCSAWTFYGRTYRKLPPEAIVEDARSIREPHVFIVDDVAFADAEHGMAIAEAFERRGIRKEYYLETRADVLLKNPEVFRRWAKLGLVYMFLGLEAIDEEGLQVFRKRTTPAKNFEALEVARRLKIDVAVNIIADPAWDERRFEVVREWAMKVPEIVHFTVQTPYPGTEIWETQERPLTTRDYRLFDVQHAVTPTTLPLERFYEEVVKTQGVLARKHLGWKALKDCAGIAARRVLRGQTNFVRMLWKFNSVYNARRQHAEHQLPVRYEMGIPPGGREPVRGRGLFVHQARSPVDAN